MIFKIVLCLIVFSVLDIATSVAGEVEQYQNCCFCFTDNIAGENTTSPQDYKKFKNACEDWLDRTSKTNGCEYQKIDGIEFVLFKKQLKTVQCQKAFVYGAFHGLSSYYEVPFNISKLITERYSAKEVCYDGFSCLVFNNTDDVLKLGDDLAQTDVDRKYEISGNQNRACTFWDGLHYREIYEMSSRMTVIVNHGSAQFTYSNCSKPGDACAVEERKDEGTKSNPNSKKCSFNGKIVNQHCCATKVENGKITESLWAKPGNVCKKINTTRKKLFSF